MKVVRVIVEAQAEGVAKPPVGSPIIVQVRDTALQDAPATILGEGRTVVSGQDVLASIEFDVGAIGTEPTVWAHVDVDRDGRVSRGDYVTVQAYPLPRMLGPRIRVALKKV